MKNFFEFGYTYDILYDVIEKNIKIKLFFASRGLMVNSWMELSRSSPIFFKILENEFGSEYGITERELTNKALNMILGKDKQLEFEF